jgi:type IV pilus assembly protein PilA
MAYPAREYNKKSFGAMLLGETMNKKQKGFSLIELLIVVAIILIIAAIAIPSFQTGPTVLLSLQTPAGGCPAAGAVAAAACLIDSNLAAGQKSGYLFVAVANGGAGTVASPNTGFEENATPITVGTTGQRSFCADMSGVLHFNLAGTAIGTAIGTCAGLGAAAVLQ